MMDISVLLKLTVILSAVYKIIVYISNNSLIENDILFEINVYMLHLKVLCYKSI